jgi:hypothetical protein
MKMDEKKEHGSDDHGAKDQIKLEVATPNGVFRGTFDNNTKVEQVIAAIIKDKHLAAGDAFELYYGDTILQPVERPLVSFGLTGTVKLTPVATGSGV